MDYYNYLSNALKTAHCDDEDLQNDTGCQQSKQQHNLQNDKNIESINQNQQFNQDLEKSGSNLEQCGKDFKKTNINAGQSCTTAEQTASNFISTNSKNQQFDTEFDVEKSGHDQLLTQLKLLITKSSNNLDINYAKKLLAALQILQSD